MDIDINSLPVIHKEEKDRFEIQIESYVAQLTYVVHDGTILFTHTGVPGSLEGRGIGARLVKAGLDYARANSLKVKSICWFVTAYLRRHTEYQDLL